MRFPEFTEEWETKKLGEISSVSSGGTPSRANPLYWDGDIPWISTTLIDFNLIEKSEEYITQEGLENSSAKLFPIGTLLMAMYGQGKTRGKVAILNIEATTNQACGAIITNEEVLNSFFAFQNLVKRYDEIRDLSNQGSQENLSGGIIKGIKITFPKLSEQIKITSFLSLIDERIQTQNKIIEQLETLIKGLSEKLFSQEIRFKEFTDKWELKKLGDISTITTGSSNREDSMLNGEYTFFDRSQDIRTSSRFLFDKEAVIVPGEGQEFIPKYFIGKFDLHQRTYAIFDFSGIYGKYLYYHLLNDDKYLQSQAVGSTVKSLRLPMLQSMPIKSPCLDEQTTIANFLSVIETKIQTEKNILDKYHSQKQYLLQNLFI
ncbi:restriction endonuclease subunit S [Elizabethkingia anophelis]|uniref:restriction endonuclease subunit S n=1 Tax=Elizabethkingia anophelis TaxID=1117645 RepID=UPI0021A6C39A|nr:restriction endonuclease subunit S [Elizabethkingia anophelis]